MIPSMGKTTLASLMLLLLPTLPGCAVCDWLFQGFADNYSGAAESSERWQNATGHDNWRQDDFRN